MGTAVPMLEAERGLGGAEVFSEPASISIGFRSLAIST